MTLNEVIAAEFATVHGAARRGRRLRRSRTRACGPASPSSRARSSRSSSRQRLPRADRAGARARGRRRSSCARTGSTPGPTAGGCIWRVTDGSARSAASRASGARLPAERQLVYVGDGYSDRCAALAADRVFARRGLAGVPRRAGRPYEPFDDLCARRCCCASLSRTTSSSRPSASARSAPTSRTSGTRAACTASSAGGRCGSRRRPGGVRRRAARRRDAPVVRRCSGARSTSTRSTRGRAGRAGPATARRRALAGFRPPLAPDPFESARRPRSPRSRSRSSPRSRSATG